LKIDDIDEEDYDELTTQQSKMLDDILSFLEQCKKKSENKNFVVCIRSMVRSGDVITDVPGVIKTSQQSEVSFPCFV